MKRMTIYRLLLAVAVLGAVSWGAHFARSGTCQAQVCPLPQPSNG